ncbi:unnamed protein product [Rotaria socialis]|uniref:Neurotransmitter-gated ion-channel transmembrane domain-containing protein n=1 Tax=Rotaria socialis TaxID=392032 RepID=A0A817WIH6_9BILA|nr:unnamed protein product [Rotaria socialis]CAF4230417.1 unnamed protein product [Rotaria socialis]
MFVFSSALAVFQKTTEEFSHQFLSVSSKTIKVYVHLVFLRIGEIDTLNEKYQAQASIESRWSVELENLLPNLSSDEQQRLMQGKSISLIKYTEFNWHPQLYIENALGDLKEQIRYSATISRTDNKIYICEHRNIKGSFWEKLELYHFPSDVQELSISVGSMLYDDKVLLIVDPYYLSGINREVFIDQQEWSLFEHVDTKQRYLKEFLFQGGVEEYNDEDDYGNTDNNNNNNNKDRNRSIFTVTCYAARQSNYFYWNGYCMIFLITSVSFCIFTIPPNLSANRLQISCTLLLTSITFRWTVNRSLPTISYSTSMDKYAIMCLFILVILSIWHAIIGGLILRYTSDFHKTSITCFINFDRYVLYVSLIIYILIHGMLLIWLFCVPLKHRRQLKQKDIQYRQLLSKKCQLSKKKLENNSDYVSISIQI